MTRRNWSAILEMADDIVAEYPYRITLRQLHYRLVMTRGLGYVNTRGDYTQLSSRTAEGRRNGTFPALLDQTREIHVPPSWTGPADALRALAAHYRRDRTENQEVQIVLGGEKATLLAQLDDWFGNLGLPIVLLRGYGSQTYLDEVAAYVRADGRPALLVYAGDFDPSGEDILRDFQERCPVFDEIDHVAVTANQIGALGLVKNQGKATDTRAARFTSRHGELVQVEVEAIEPAVLRGLYQAAIDPFLDSSRYAEVLALEEAERARLSRLAEREGAA